MPGDNGAGGKGRGKGSHQRVYGGGDRAYFKKEGKTRPQKDRGHGCIAPGLPGAQAPGRRGHTVQGRRGAVITL